MRKKLLKISIVGKTNAGKSTLINNLVGEKISVINKKINTTEDSIIGIVNIKENQLIFIDTPGVNYLKNIDKKKIKLKQNLWHGLNESDEIFYLIDIKQYNFEELRKKIYKLNELNKEISIIFNKNDLVSKNLILPKIKEIKDKLKINTFFSISAKKRLGLDVITNYLLNKTYYSKWIYKENEISDKDDIFITNEITRNFILTYIHKEIPYNIKVINKVFKYLKNGDLKIKQNIQINNLRYKKIILGKNGEKIKDIRIKSQNEISRLFKTKIHLYINVIKFDA